MAGIAIPIALHLWNNKRGRVLAIGSVTFLEKTSPRQSRTRRLSEWLLLLLRCLLLLAAALLLAGPFWRRAPRQGSTKGWLLVAAGADSANGYAGLIDSLVKAGYEKHVWGRANRSYWALFAEADRKAPAGMPFYIFTDGRANHFFGLRPFTERRVNWYTYTPAPASSGDSVSHWIGSAWLSSPDSVAVLAGSSRSTGTVYQLRIVPAREDRPGEGGNGFHIRMGGGGLSVALDSQAPVRVDTGALRIHIYADKKYSNDSRYLVAALRALQQFTKRRVQVAVDVSAGEKPAGVAAIGNGGGRAGAGRPDWVFWLSSQPVARGVAASNLLLYEPGREVAVDSWISGKEGEAVDGRINREVMGVNRQPIWQDGFGRPVLAMETVMDTITGVDPPMRVFHFFSHFDPSWNGLVWSSSFPVLLQGLLSGSDTAEDDQHDLRILDPGQVTPLKGAGGMDASLKEGDGGTGLGASAEAEGGGPGVGRPEAGDGGAGFAEGGRAVAGGQGAGRPAADRVDLAPACWVILLLLLIAERFVSFMDPKTKVYG